MNEIYQQIVRFIQEQITQNELFKGGLILGVGAALLSYARVWPSMIWGWIVYHTTVELDVPEGSEAFKWIDKWLSDHKYSEKRARRLTAKSYRNEGVSIPHIAPAPGRHYLFEGGRLIILTRHRTQLETANNNGKAYTESMTLTIVGRSRTPALKILQKAFALADKPKQTITVSYCDDYGSWFELTEKKPRSINTIVLPQGIRESIIDDVYDFLARQEFYSSLGVPWRRGYLFYGSPGNGKTSTIFAMASELKMDISYLNLKEVTDTTLVRAFADLPSNSILVIEDIDCLFKEEDSRETKATISFAGLINALDGVMSPDGQIVIMTTNKREKLDKALIRPGRVDKEIHFEDATLEQACKLFMLFYPSGDVVAFREAYKHIRTTMSMAALQGHFLINKDSTDALDLKDFK